MRYIQLPKERRSAAAVGLPSGRLPLAGQQAGQTTLIAGGLRQMACGPGVLAYAAGLDGGRGAVAEASMNLIPSAALLAWQQGRMQPR